MPRPPRAKVVTSRTTAWVKNGPEGNNASSETLLDGTNPQWRNGPNHTRAGKKGLAISGALSDEEARTTYPESDLLKSAKEKKRKAEEKQQKRLEAEKLQNLRKSQKEQSEFEEQLLEEGNRRRTTRGDDDSLITVRSTQTALADMGHNLKNTINNVVSAVGRRASTRAKAPRQKHDAKVVLESVTAQKPNSSPHAQPLEEQFGSALKPQATPSSLSLANFKRRPRQPSLLTMVRQSIANADEVANDKNSDLEEDSVLAGLQRSSPSPQPSDSRAPIDTPVAHSSSSRKRKAAALAEQITSPTRRPEEAGHMPSETAHLPVATSSPLSFVATVLEEGNDVPRKEPAMSHRSSRSTLKDNHSMSYLQPSLGKEVASPQFCATSPISSPPASTIRQPDPETQTLRARKKSKVAHITTATLQALLPRRRQPHRKKQHGAFDIPSDDTVPTTDGATEGEEDDIDELSRPARRRAKAKKSAPQASQKPTATKSRKAIAKTTSKTTNAATVKLKAAPPKIKPTRTYGRDAKEDKENAADDDDDDDEAAGGSSDVEVIHDEDEDVEVVRVVKPGRVGKSRELAEAKKKFEAVDEWELEFESGDMAGGSSSPWR